MFQILGSDSHALSFLKASVGLSNENFSVVCMETNKKNLSQVKSALVESLIITGIPEPKIQDPGLKLRIETLN